MKIYGSQSADTQPCLGRRIVNLTVVPSARTFRANGDKFSNRRINLKNYRYISRVTAPSGVIRTIVYLFYLIQPTPLPFLILPRPFIYINEIFCKKKI